MQDTNEPVNSNDNPEIIQPRIEQQLQPLSDNQQNALQQGISYNSTAPLQPNKHHKLAVLATYIVSTVSFIIFPLLIPLIILLLFFLGVLNGEQLIGGEPQGSGVQLLSLLASMVAMPIGLVIPFLVNHFSVNWLLKKITGSVIKLSIGYTALLGLSVSLSFYFAALGAGVIFQSSYRSFELLGILIAFMLFIPVFFIINILASRSVSKKIYTINDNETRNSFEIIKSALIYSRRIVYVSLLTVPLIFLGSPL